MPIIELPEEVPVEAWQPDRKIVAAAIAAIIAWLAQLIVAVDVPPGIEAAVAVVVAYLVPGTADAPLSDHPGDHNVSAEDLPTFTHHEDDRER